MISVGSAFFAWQQVQVAKEQAKIAKESVVVSEKQLQVAKETLDRSNGKIRAQFAFVQSKHNPEVLHRLTRKEEGRDNEVFRLDSLREVVEWGPHVTIQNTGEEVIDGLRTEVAYAHGRAYGFGVKQVVPMPMVLNGASINEVTTFGKLMPKQKAIISLHSLLLDQMMQATSEVYPEKDREGTFKVQVFCRIVGATTYDAIEPKREMTLTFHGKPTVISDRDKCEALCKLPPIVHIATD